MNIQPNGARILVERLDDEANVTPGGIIVPDTAKALSQKGKVVQVGPDSKYQKGDIIAFGRYSGVIITLEHNNYLILADNEILATLCEV